MTGHNGYDTDDPTLDDDTDWKQASQDYYDPVGPDGLTTTVVAAIAQARGVSLADVKSPSLYEVVDLAGIEAAFFGPKVTGSPRQGTGTVRFRYEDLLVKIRSDGWVQVFEQRDLPADLH